MGDEQMKLLEKNQFQPHIGSLFAVKGLETETPVLLELIEIDDRSDQLSSKSESPVECWTLVFKGPTEVNLGDETRELKHDTIGELALFLCQSGTRVDGILYEAVVSKVKE